MTFHLAAFSGVTGSGVPAYPLTPVNDMHLPSTTSGFLLPSPMSIIAAYAMGAGNVDHAGLLRASIVAPSLLRTSYPYIRPVSRNKPELTDPNVMNLVSNPIALPASENVGVQVAVDQPTGGGVAVLLWFAEEHVPAPAGDRFTLRFATTTAPATPSSAAWSPVGTVTFDQSLPPGVYTVVGFEHWSPGAIAARLVFPGMHMRPGTLSMSGGTSFPADKRTDRLFYEGRIGVYGSFNSFAPPSMEVLSLTGGATTHEAYLTVIRTGDAAPGSGPTLAASSVTALR